MDNPAREKTKIAERLVKNSIWLFLAEALSKILALGIQIFAARYLGDRGFGIFSFAFALTGAFIVFVDIGISVFLTREVARKPDQAQDYIRNVFALKWGLTIVMLLAMWVVFHFTPMDPATMSVVLTIGMALIVNGYTDMYIAVFRGLEKMSLVSALMVLPRALFLALGLAALILGYDVVVFSQTFLTVSVLVFLISHWQMRTRIPAQRSGIDRSKIKAIFYAVIPICAVILFSYIYFRIDAVMVFFLLGESETGWYSAAFKLIEALSLLVASIRGALFPILSRTFSERSEGYQKIWKGGARYLFMIGIPMVGGVVFLAPRLIELLFGDSYVSAVPVLQVMVIGFPLLCLNDFASFFLMSRDQTRQILKVVGSGAAFNVILNMMIIPIWGIVGAAATASVTQLFIFLYYCKCIGESGVRWRMGAVIWRPTVAAAGMSLILWQFANIPLGFLVGIAVVSYFLILNILQSFDEYDFLVLRGIFNRGGLSKRPTIPALPPDSLDLSIITVNYKSMDHLRNCLRTIKETVKNIRYEVIVIDNDSGDGSGERIRSEFPEVRLIENRENLGFARANNQGIQISSGKYVLLLNNDTLVLPGSIETMVGIMERSPETGLLGCRLLNKDRSVQLSFGRTLSMTNEFGRKFILNRLLDSYNQPLIRKIVDWLFSIEQEVDWISGACMLLRRQTFAEVGLLDENIFMYMEDVDFGVRMKRAGWGVMYTPEAQIIHFGGESASKNPFRTNIEYRRSQLYFYKKHYGGSGLYRLKMYLYLKMAFNFVRSYMDRLVSNKSSGEIEQSDRLRREVFALIRDYQ